MQLTLDDQTRGEQLRRIDDCVSLDELAEQINEQHRRCEQAALSAIECAKAAGDALLEAKAKVPHGDWLDWITAHCDCTARTAQRYMLICRDWEKLQANTTRASSLSLRDAARLLSVSAEEDHSMRRQEVEIDSICVLFTRYPGDIEGLAANIEMIGLLNPVVLDGQRQLIAGFRRLEAFKLLGRQTIPCTIHPRLNTELKRVKAYLSTNIMREDLTISEKMELARAIEEKEAAKASARLAAEPDQSEHSSAGRHGGIEA